MRPDRLVVLASVWMAVVGCASVYTMPDKTADNGGGDGIAYYMPNRAILVSVAIDEKGAMTPTVSEGQSYADVTGQRYLVNSNINLIGNSKGKIGVSARGLLTSTTAETTSQVGEILKNAASSAGGLESLGTQGGPTRAVCASGMTHTVQVRPETLSFSSVEPGAVAAASSLCEYVITVTRPFHQAPPPPAQARPAQDRAGLYYRQAMPYVVTLTRLIPAPPPADTVKKAAPRRSRGHRTPPPAPASPAPRPQYQEMEFLVFSPTGAPTHFAPLPHSLFASGNKTVLAFDDGVLKDYDRSVDSELVSVAKLPADVLTTYATALGSAFTARKARADNETADRLRENTDAITNLRIQLCREAVASKETARIEAACATKP